MSNSNQPMTEDERLALALILAVPLVLAIALHWLAYPVPSDRVRAVCGWPRKVIGKAFRKAAGLP